MAGTRFSLECQPHLPPSLSRLEEMANNLLYSWDRELRGLFFRLDSPLWEQCGHNPKVFLRRVSQERLEAIANDKVFLEDYRRVLSSFDTYLQESHNPHVLSYLDPEKDLVAYSCAEFGLHESLPLYSGGLGILAGDHCKAASDLCVPFVAMGMLYRQGYFVQRIDGAGNQIATYIPTNFADLPIRPARDAEGNEVHVRVPFPGREVELKVWHAKPGHIDLYLLDCDLEINSDEDRRITYQLYGGDRITRIQQEIVLGIGGVRAKRALGLKPTVYHINEGHAAFQVLERCRVLIAEGLDFKTAIEVVAASTVFTTHTPVAAGHDIFEIDLVRHYFKDYVAELKISMEEFIGLGSGPHGDQGFNMTALALRGSRFTNGVSRIHGGVAAEMERYIWPQVPPEENPIRYVTNGIHLPTFLSSEWANLFDTQFGGSWRSELTNVDYWGRIDTIPSHSFWSRRQTLKANMLQAVGERVTYQHQRNGCSGAQIRRLTQHLNPRKPDILTIGFARRFATYKRATLLFSNAERLAKMVNNPARPMLIVFAGKAHPSDKPGQAFIRSIYEMSRRPEFEGKVIMVENYDMALARKLVTGVDIWLNNPEYPLEASGTSGQKAGINGVINLSVLDGWWDEGFDGENGWAITPHGPAFSPEFRDREEANELYDVLEQEIIPLYYERDGHGYSEGWIKRSKASMKSLIPRFNSERMVLDYVKGFYGPAARQNWRMNENNYAAAKELAEWKQKIRAQWHNVKISVHGNAPSALFSDQTLSLEVAINLGGLNAEDVLVDCLIGTESRDGEFTRHSCCTFQFSRFSETGQAVYRLSVSPEISGLQAYMVRAYPYHRLLSQRFEMGYMIWL